jgi:hypothetical protein
MRGHFFINERRPLPPLWVFAERSTLWSVFSSTDISTPKPTSSFFAECPLPIFPHYQAENICKASAIVSVRPKKHTMIGACLPVGRFLAPLLVLEFFEGSNQGLHPNNKNTFNFYIFVLLVRLTHPEPPYHRTPTVGISLIN